MWDTARGLVGGVYIAVGIELFLKLVLFVGNVLLNLLDGKGDHLGRFRYCPCPVQCASVIKGLCCQEGKPDDLG